MTDNLASARIKLQRANLHAGVARRETRRFYRRQTDPTLGIEPEGDHSGLGIGDTFVCKVVVQEGWPPLPAQFSARFGDAIHNYRCVLDHIAWQLVSHGVRPPASLDNSARSRVQFPIYTAAKSFDNNVEGRLPGVDPVVADFVKSRHVYVRGQATNDALLRLSDLSNDDKHKTLTLIASAFLSLKTEAGLTDCEFVRRWDPPVVPPAATKDAIIGFVEFRITGPNPHVGMKLTPSLHVALEDGAGFGTVLAEIEAEVRTILDAPEIRAAIT